ncbi:MAG: asparagine synthase (glutamine-hydrolyzing) [Candidatus Omnitrophota bacterium]|jgi:asparagine synthase (glutamine-hydrolysing)
MCGIAGIVNLDRKPADRGILEEMVKSLRHRGPDDMGVYLDGFIGLGHARLSIIDLSKVAHQPMPNEDSTLYIVHNGEIYNYVELREELARLGHIFRSRSDTEVIIHAYEEWGEDCLKHFNGMWAFAILDIKKKEIFCARDRFGVKPFYYYLDDSAFIFASEIKGLLVNSRIKREANDKAVFNYLASGYGYMDISDETFFRSVRQLKAAHYIKLSIPDKKFIQVKYWDLDPNKRALPRSESQACDKFRELFEDSVRLRLRSDVPLGISLSGGLDSSSIACIAADILKGSPIETFSSCFEDDKYDERKFINLVLERTKARPNFIFTKPEHLFGEMEEIIWHQDEPYSTLSIFPQWYVMKAARDKGVKVLLTGQGGDEILAGYHKYYFYLFADLIRSFKWPDAVREIDIYRSFKGDEDVAGRIFKILFSYSTPRTFKNLIDSIREKKTPDYLDREFVMNSSGKVKIERKFSGILNNDLYNALKISPLPSLLHIDDRSSMAHSVETRAPFLDYRLVEYLFSLGPEYKIKNGFTKYILRESLKGILPDKVRLRRDKMGFATPLEKWFKADLKDKVREILNSREFRSRPYFNSENVMKTYELFIEGKKDACYAVWSWINLELWLRRFIDTRQEHGI